MYFRVIFVFLLCAVMHVDYVENARILGVFHLPSFSHNIVGKTLLKALAKRGHEITMISPFPLETPLKNYEDIYIDSIMKFKEESVVEMLMQVENGSYFEKLSVTIDVLTKMHEICLNDTLVKNLLNSNRNFDLVMMDWVLNDGMLGIANHFNAPVIVISPVGSSLITNKITLNPAPYSYVPNHLIYPIDEMTFLERVGNTLSTMLLQIHNHFFQEQSQELFLHKYFPKAPPLKQLIENISMVFLNSHFSVESPRPYVPNMIQIGGLHLEEPKELEPGLKKFMDEASEGVLYFSFGGNTQSSDLTPEKVQVIVKTLGKIPLKVLWKFEDDKLKLPTNVKIAKWVPQRDILAHPNLRVFVTHGGWLSTIEAVYRGVPMVGIPCFSDQESNVKNSVHNGYSTMVKLEELTERTLTAAIMEIMKNPKYRENVKRRSLWLKDRPIKPLDNAIYWVEYVLKYNGAAHLKTAALQLSWYQYLLLDVFAFVAAIVLMTYLMVIRFVKMLISLVFKKRKTAPANIESKKRN